MELLSVKGLTVKVAFRNQVVTALDQISFTLSHGERLGIVGESEAGKSVTGFSIINLISEPGYIDQGEILFAGMDLAKLNDKQLGSIRGNQIAMIFQDSMVTFNPVLTIG